MSKDIFDESHWGNTLRGLLVTSYSLGGGTMGLQFTPVHGYASLDRPAVERLHAALGAWLKETKK